MTTDTPARPADRLLTASEVARVMGGGNITPETVLRRWRKWGLPGVRIGKTIRWWESDVYEYLRDHPAT